MKTKEGKTILSKLEQRVLEISYKFHLSHIGSCLTAVRIIDMMYQAKEKDDLFILSSGHAGVALYVILEKYEKRNAEALYLKHGVHPNRDIENGIYASTGSLGHGIGIAVGMALVNRKRNIWCLMSDGECAEGSVWEALRIAAENRLENLRVGVNGNGWGAFSKVDIEWLDSRLQFFYPSLMYKSNLYEYPEWLQGQNGHYAIMTDEQYKELK